MNYEILLVKTLGHKRAADFIKMQSMLTSIGSGLITLTRILRCFRSTVHERANDRIAALLAL